MFIVKLLPKVGVGNDKGQVFYSILSTNSPQKAARQKFLFFRCSHQPS